MRKRQTIKVTDEMLELIEEAREDEEAAHRYITVQPRSHAHYRHYKARATANYERLGRLLADTVSPKSEEA